jgi:phage terminase large subunit-like protein
LSYLYAQYIDDVLSGRVVTCRWVRLAVERHLRDLKEGPERGLFFDEKAAQHAIDFYQFLRHSKGEWAGQVFVLEPWEQFIEAMLFGWKRADGTRRFRTSYEEIARKNGKSTRLSARGLYLFFADGEAGAEVYTAATKRDQARITHSEATRMVKSSPQLRKRIGVFKDNLHIEATASKYEPLGKDADSTDGLNVHAAILDEVHAHKNRDMYDALDTGTGARRQPLISGITTSGVDRQGICYELHDFTKKILEGLIQDDTFFGIIYTLDVDEKGELVDDWQDEACWGKANPNLDISVKRDDLRRKAERARESPTALNAFLRKHMDIWTTAETRWILPDKWALCSDAVDAEGLLGRKCYGGLDLSSTTDTSSLVLVFPPETDGDLYKVLARFWIPQENMQERVRKDRVPYDVWVRQGFITATPGNIIDYEFILDQIDKDAQAYDLQEIAFDRWGSTQIIQWLQDKGMTVVQFGQGYASMSAPTKSLEKMVLAHEITHGGNPVLAWQASNVIITQDASENQKPDKAKSRERIDGIVATIMALDRALRHETRDSVYKSRGFRILGGSDEDLPEDTEDED